MTPDNLVSDVSICLVAHNPAFEDPQLLAACLTQGLNAAGLQVDGMVGIRGDNYYEAPLPATGISNLIQLNRAVPILLSHSDGLLDFTRTPASYLGDYWSENLELRLWLKRGVPWARATNIFCTLTQEIGCFWGEVINNKVVGQPTLCGPNEHQSQVPNLANVNYFGPEYVKLFGGIERFTSAPGLSVANHGPGILTSLDPSLSHEEYLRVRSAIRVHLGERLFHPLRDADRAIYLQLFGPSDPSCDPNHQITLEPHRRAGDAEFEKMCRFWIANQASISSVFTSDRRTTIEQG